MKMTTQGRLTKLAEKLHEPARRHTSEDDYRLMLSSAVEIRDLRRELQNLRDALNTVLVFMTKDTE